MSRRKLAIVFTLAFCLSACSTAWLTTFENYLKIAGPILIQILDIVSLAKGDPANPVLVAKINTDQAAVETIAQSISTATAADIPSKCAVFNVAVKTFSSDLSTIEQLANVGQKASGEIQAALGIAQAAIQEVEAPIQACQSSPTPAIALARLQETSLKVTSPEDVVKRFNACVDSKHKIHLHNSFVRFLTLGNLQ